MKYVVIFLDHDLNPIDIGKECETNCFTTAIEFGEFYTYSRKARFFHLQGCPIVRDDLGSNWRRVDV